MYDRYKVAKGKKRYKKVIIIVLLICAMVYLGNRYKQYIMFWRYSSNKLIKSVDDASSITDRQKKRSTLTQLSERVDIYKDSNQIDPDAYLLSGKVHFLLGESHLPGNFSELLINDRSKKINSRAHKEFITTIKDIKKAIGYLEDDVPIQYSMILAKACYYTNYITPTEIQELFSSVRSAKNIPDVEDVRFYALIGILVENDNKYLKELENYGKVNDSVLGKLVLATTERIAKKYTNAIIHYKQVLHKSEDTAVLKLVHVNLGKIYYSKSLYKESLAHFGTAFKMDEKDSDLKIWIGKNYFALGDKERARAVWNEVLSKDRTNKKVIELIGAM